MASPIQELVIQSVLNAAQGVDLPGRTREDAVRESVGLLVNSVTGMCQKTGESPFDGNTCGCVPCRAWRTEAAERLVSGLKGEVERASRSIEELDSEVATRDTKLASLADLLDRANADIVAEKEAHEETAQALSNTQFLVDRGKDTIAGLQNNLADAQATVASMEIELERLRALEEKVSAFTATLGS